MSLSAIFCFQFLLVVQLDTVAVSYSTRSGGALGARLLPVLLQKRLYIKQQRSTISLRGGLWYDGADEDDSGSYYYTDEEDDPDYNPLDTQAPDWVRQIEPDPTIVRADEGLTEEEIQNHPYLIPVGGWNNGFFPEYQGKGLERYRESLNATDYIPPERMRPQRLRDVYGLGKYVMNSSESPYTEEYYDKSRNILRVPPDQLPREFHLRVDPTQNVSFLFTGTLAEKFSEWYGPVPESWSAVVYEENGPIFLYSGGLDDPMYHDDLVKQFGGEQTVQFFYDATHERVKEKRVDFDTLNNFIPGPAIFDEFFPCSRAPGVEMFQHPPRAGELDDVYVPDDVSFLFRAVRAVKAGQRLVCRKGTHKWGAGSEDYPRWELQLDKNNTPFHICGQVRAKPKHVKHEQINCSKLSDRWEGVLATKLHGQWCMFDGSCGSFSNVFICYTSIFRQTLMRVFSGPWLIDHCCFKSSHVTCILAACNSQVQLRDSFIGGTGPEVRYHETLPGLAFYGVAMIANSNVSLNRCVLEDIGFEGGCAIALNDCSQVYVNGCEFNRCRLAVHLAQFAHVELESCLIYNCKHAAFCAVEVYYPVPEEYHKEFGAIVESERFQEDEQGNLYSLLTPEENPDGTFFNETNSTVAMMVIKNCSVQGTIQDLSLSFAIKKI
ncbi:hypothetical protein GUITHDRAFT_114863 [Guillardia theta CCMP2712]|uniref:Right handed beta helix domain-containing protein n=1 Tax=Guillardia theta (strain CCMP2712) TaxID=905079 RepID=L1IRW5_GUITC|nr:hypothetical protein GUITHDRAFT_114863 [Guillardia theta CCMP2712]EKX38983.1 hypothetical protein GUITHDRAFT_114863 [Guillardia theta CCMP2712]|eukprot:XP_005825963.1 hypothetical protein GUITHDRAFT_114863 [Guillardia theta CCMP2712]